LQQYSHIGLIFPESITAIVHLEAESIQEKHGKVHLGSVMEVAAPLLRHLDARKFLRWVGLRGLETRMPLFVSQPT
jgi:hypothetical protein